MEYPDVESRPPSLSAGQQGCRSKAHARSNESARVLQTMPDLLGTRGRCEVGRRTNDPRNLGDRKTCHQRSVVERNGNRSRVPQKDGLSPLELRGIDPIRNTRVIPDEFVNVCLDVGWIPNLQQVVLWLEGESSGRHVVHQFIQRRVANLSIGLELLWCHVSTAFR